MLRNFSEHGGQNMNNTKNRTYRLTDECIQKIEDISCMTNTDMNTVIEKMILQYAPDPAEIRFIPKKKV